MISEEQFEIEILDKLKEIGWEEKQSINRGDYCEVVDWNELKQRIISINNITDSMADKAIFEIKKINDNDAKTLNEKAWILMNEGVKVIDEDTSITKSVKLISKISNQNSYWAIRQFEVVTIEKQTRIPDIVLFINGLPAVVMELKSPEAVETVEDAYNQNCSLMRLVPQLWKFNIMNFVSNRITSKYGSITSGFKRFHSISNLKTRDQKDLIPFLFSFDNLLTFIATFEYYSNERNSLIKYIAAPHQIEAVNLTIQKLKNTNDNKGGVVWHTQGSGKSITMLILAKSIIKNFPNSTILVVTDRKDLDNQLLSTFLNAKEYLRNESISIESRKDLIEKLNDKKNFGIYFTTVQKFYEDTGLLTNRSDVFVLVDEAHRSQNNISGEIEIDDEKKEAVMKYGYGKYMRDAFPNSKLIAFTGTPLMKDDTKTIEIFGDYTHKYLMNDAVADGTTVPIHYEMRKVKISLNEEYLKEMDDIQNKYIKTLDPYDIHSSKKIDELLKNIRLKEILEDEDVIKAKSKDILKHLEKRSKSLHGKAMIVANTRRAAYEYYKSILEINPSLKNEIILVMTESNKDGEEMAKSIVPKREVINAANEFRKDNSKYKIAIVVDMWLTGFDVQDLDTLYIDKIIKWHNLMQAIARVNRTYEDKKTGIVKTNGLIVDYIGIWKYLSQALSQYTGKNDLVDFSIEDINEAKNKLLDNIDIINDNYIRGIINFPLMTEKERYNFIMHSFDKMLELNKEEKNKFVILARESKRFYKMSVSTLDDKTIMICKGIETINSLLGYNSVENDYELQRTIELIKNSAKNSIDMKTEQVQVSESKISKNINDVADILEKEASEQRKINPRVSIEMMKHSIHARIREIEKLRPIFAEKASNKLRDIINELQKTEDVDNTLNLLQQLAKEIVDEQNKSLDYDDIELQAFYEILANDEYLKQKENSQVLRKIAEEILEKVKSSDLDQFATNKRVKSLIKKELKILLKTKYKYPPESLGGASGILIDQITKRIKLNPSYFKGEQK